MMTITTTGGGRIEKQMSITLCCNIKKLRHHTFNLDDCMVDVSRYFLQILLKRIPTDTDIRKYSLVHSTSKRVYPLEFSIRECNLVNNDIFESILII